MKAITTKYHGPTNHRGSRISASAEGGHRVTVIYDDALNMTDGENHDAAVRALCQKCNWGGTLVRGQLANGGYVYVWAHTQDTLTVGGRPKLTWTEVQA